MIIHNILNMKRNFFFAVGLTLSLFACDNSHDDMYDPTWMREQYNNQWEMQFGEIDPNHTWNMAKQVKANLSIQEDALSEYTFKIYSANPLANSDAKLLAYVKTITDASGNGTTNVNFDVLDGARYVWVSRVDSHKRRLVKMAAIEDGQLNVAFGTPATSRSLSSRASVDVDAVPYTTKQLNEWMKSGYDLSNWESLPQVVKDWKSIAACEGVYYVPSGVEIDCFFHASGSGLERGKVKLIIAGTLNISQDMALGSGVEVIIANGGVLNSTVDLLFTNNSGLIMMPESELNAESNSIIFTNGSGINGRNYANYIAGKLNVRVLNNNGGTTYNCGNNVYIGELQGSSPGSTFINNGNVVIGGIHSADDKSLQYVVNNCSMTVNGDARLVNVTLGANSSLVVKGVLMLAEKLDNDIAELNMGSSSILDVNKFKGTGGNIIGPIASSNNQYALIKCKEVVQYSINNGWPSDGTKFNNGYIINDIYLQLEEEIKQNLSNDPTWWNWQIPSNDYVNPAGRMALALNNAYSQIGSGNAALATNNEAPFFATAGDCTVGNEPVDEGDDPVIEEETIQSWTVACEDLGSIGDFDFNDVVFKVSHVSGSGEITVTPLAAGGTMTVNLYHGSQLLGEIHKLLGEDDVTKMLNTGVEGEKGYNPGDGNSITLTVDDSFSMTDNMGGFSLEILNGKGRFEAKIEGPVSGDSPQMICMPGEWRWPREWQNITLAYEKFPSWSTNSNNTEWYNTYNEEYIY